MPSWDEIWRTIIPEPRDRPLWQRTLYWLGTMFLATWKLLRLPVGFLPPPIQSILRNWTPEMYRVVITSWVTRAYIDQPCVFNTQPEQVAVKADVQPRYALSEQQLRAFARDGFLGPFDAFTESEVTALREQLLRTRERPSENFGIVTDRDLHLETPAMLEFMRHPAILEVAAQLLGPDLMTWRSQLFFKGPGGREIQWHQASTYLLEDYLDPVLVPPDRNQLFQLTVWIALGPATKENGCLQFIPGTHDCIRTIRFGGERGFYQVSFNLEFDRDPARVTTMEMKAGQFVIFSERVIHGSGPNQTDEMRFAMNYRLLPPYVKVYPNQNYHRAMHMGQAYSLDRWGTVLLRGTDAYGYNRRAAADAAHR
jgi:non-heme Fe2+,alpha-ketoglutarate-dependent halogenase